MKQPKRILIVGGVAGGASVAARARRMNESAEIIIFERGPFVSFANCGLPYYIGNVIEERPKLLVTTPEKLKGWLNIDVKTLHEVVKINKEDATIQVKNLETDEITTESYDALILSPGASPIKPPLKGIDLEGIFTLRTIPDADDIKQWIKEKEAKTAVVVGGGFIGLEMAENLAHLGLSVTLIEMLDQVMLPLDKEMVSTLHLHIRDKGINLCLREAVKSFEKKDNQIVAYTSKDKKYDADLVILGIGVRPEIKLAKEAGLEIGKLGGIRVNEYMQTNDDKIWAVGDVIEVKHCVTGEWMLLPLAGPANRQGRIAADNINGMKAICRGTQGTSIVKVFDLEIGCTGANEKMLQKLGMSYKKIYVHTTDHVTYYPGAEKIEFKLLYEPETGKVLGGQAIGKSGIARRIDVLALAIQMNATVFDLELAELSYAPPFGAAKDAINLAGFVAANEIRGDAPTTYWEVLEQVQREGTENPFIIDVCTPKEYEKGHIPGAANIPISEIRNRIDEIPRDRPIWVYCGAGKRGYYVLRILKQLGFDNVKNLSGGMRTFTSGQQGEVGIEAS